MIQAQLRRLPAAALATLALMTGAARAGFIHDGVGLNEPHRSVDFDGIPLGPNQRVTDQFLGLGLRFEAAFANADLDPRFPNMSGNRIGNYRAGIGHEDDFTIHFLAPTTAAAFALVTADQGISTLEAYLHGVLVEAATAPSSVLDPVNIFGFRDIVFDELRIRTASFDGALTIDNLQIANVPEPASAGLVSLSLGLVAWLRRRAMAGTVSRE